MTALTEQVNLEKSIVALAIGEAIETGFFHGMSDDTHDGFLCWCLRQDRLCAVTPPNAINCGPYAQEGMPLRTVVAERPFALAEDGQLCSRG